MSSKDAYSDVRGEDLVEIATVQVGNAPATMPIGWPPRLKLLAGFVREHFAGLGIDTTKPHLFLKGLAQRSRDCSVHDHKGDIIDSDDLVGELEDFLNPHKLSDNDNRVFDSSELHTIASLLGIAIEVRPADGLYGVMSYTPRKNISGVLKLETNPTTHKWSSYWSPLYYHEQIGDYNVRWSKVEGDIFIKGPSGGLETTTLADGSTVVGAFLGHELGISPDGTMRENTDTLEGAHKTLVDIILTLLRARRK